MIKIDKRVEDISIQGEEASSPLSITMVKVVDRWIDARSQLIKVLDSAVVPTKDVRTGCPDAPSDGFVMGRGPWLVVVIACKTCYTLVNDPDNLIRIARVGYPDVLWSGCIYGIRPDACAL
uniref:Uncharacterized protein n=1 Tax=Vitis vinifera TaxID=29760 RepID=A5BET3_VITVI|nr:hypothetical protein VITISV_022844 [Vitis vinifera]